MAQNETWLNHDMMGAVKVKYLDGNVFSQDNAGNLIGVLLTKGGVDYSGGGSVAANVIRADGATVAVTGALSGNAATVVLPQAAYAVPGVLSIIIKLTVSGEITTIAAVVANVYQSTTDSAVDPGTIIPSIETLIDEIEAAVASIPADYSDLWTSLASNFSNQTSYNVGDYVTYNGSVYRFISDHPAGAWSTSQVTAVSVAPDLKKFLRQDDYGINIMASVHFEDGKFLNASGGLGDAPAWRTYYLIPVHGITTVHVFGIFGKLAVQNTGTMWAYDKNKAAISVAFDTASSSAENDTDVTLPTGTEYISVCTTNSRAKLGGVYVNITDLLKGNEQHIFNEYGIKTARVINTTKNGIMSWSFSNGIYTLTWNGTEETDRFYVKVGKSQYSVGTANTNTFVFPSGGLSCETSSSCAVILRDSTKEVLLVTSGSIVYGDIILAWIYVNGTIYFENNVLFTNVDESVAWDNILDQQNDGLFGRTTHLYSGTVEIDTTEKTVTLSNISVLGSKNATYILSNYSNTFDYSQLPNPTYSWAICINTSGAYIKNVRDLASEQAGKTQYDYLLFAFFNNIIMGAESMKRGSWFINGNDVTVETNQSFLYSNTARIFRKVVCCGDSFTSGHIVDSGGTAHVTNEDYAWPHYMELITGNTYVNCGSSGSNVLTWQTVPRGLAKAQSSGRSQAYLIGLAINDSSTGTAHVDVGVPSDIGTNNQTYYGGLSKIVRELHTISPDAKIFLQTCPRPGVRYEPYNEAIAYIANAYHETYHTHLLDLFAYYNLYTAASITGDNIGAHYTAIGYEQFAEILNYIMSTYINANISDFQDVYSIPYDP